mmetsp:Transcript_21901/g.56343  ORF Transcript_21901/g.56343 Transcript_21901/m.56343 type:complete len:385 (+) Transcript_21901:232-1386(+)
MTAGERPPLGSENMGAIGAARDAVSMTSSREAAAQAQRKRAEENEARREADAAAAIVAEAERKRKEHEEAAAAALAAAEFERKRAHEAAALQTEKQKVAAAAAVAAAKAEAEQARMEQEEAAAAAAAAERKRAEEAAAAQKAMEEAAAAAAAAEADAEHARKEQESAAAKASAAAAVPKLAVPATQAPPTDPIRVSGSETARYDNMELSEMVLRWASDVTGKPLPDPPLDERAVHAHFKNGVLLCELINAISPGMIKRIEKPMGPFQQRENIARFLTGATDIGVESHALFLTGDLFDGTDLKQVCHCLFALGRACHGVEGYSGPTLGKAVKAKLGKHRDSTFKVATGEGLWGKSAGQHRASAGGDARMVNPSATGYMSARGSAD